MLRPHPKPKEGTDMQHGRKRAAAAALVVALSVMGGTAGVSSANPHSAKCKGLKKAVAGAKARHAPASVIAKLQKKADKACK
jgi:hypothetical protein